MWQTLTDPLAEIALIVLVWQFCSDRLRGMESRRGRAISGIVLGLVGCVSLIAAAPPMPGVGFDLRAPAVACAAYFGGWIAAAPAVILAAVPLSLAGGGGVPAGLLSLAAVAGTGLALHSVPRERARSPVWLLAVAGATACAALAGPLALPPEGSAVALRGSMVPATGLTIAATWILALLLAREIRRRDRMRRAGIRKQVLDALPDGLTARDPQGRILVTNPAAAAFRRADADRGPDGEAPPGTQMERDVLTSGETRSGEREIRLPGRPPQSVAMQAVPLRDAGGAITGVVTHERDITEQRALLRKKSEFVSTVSHELRTPLTAMRGALSMMASLPEAKAAPTLRGLLDIAHRNGDRLLRLVTDILDLERIEAGHLHFDLQECRLAEVIREAMPALSGFMPEQRVRLDFDDRAPEAVAEIDPARFEQVLANLVSNAIKVSPAGGVVTIGLSRRSGRAVVSVTDTGRGIPDAFRERIFAPFEQADPSDPAMPGGSGLGLHIAKTMVGRMNGRLRFTSSEGRGTTFFAEFPDRSAEEAARAAGRRILYVEDDDALDGVVGALLRDRARTDHVGSLADARAAIAAESYDLAVIDDALPDGSGLRLLEDLPDGTPAIAFTAGDDPGPRPRNLRRSFVKSRLDETDIRTQIDRLLARERPLAPAE